MTYRIIFSGRVMNEDMSKYLPALLPENCKYLNKYHIKIAESRLAQYLRDGIDKPSEMCPCTTVYRLISEIREKVKPYN